jgi:ribose transport system substrate-binding protein
MTMHSKTKAIATVLVMVTALAGAGAGMAATPGQPDWLKGDLKKPLSEVRIGITVLNPSSNSYQAQYASTATEYAKELGIQASIVDPQGDPSKQFSQIQNFVAQKMDAIVVWPTSAVAEVPAIRQAYIAKIPVIVSNSQIEEDARKYTVAWTGPDDCAQAKKAAKLLSGSMGGKGNIVMILGTPGYATAMLRETCFLDEMKSSPGIKVLDKQPANWSREKAQSVMENFLTKYGHSINGVYAQDDGMGLGALNAIRAAGYKKGDIKLTTANMFGEGYDAIKDGWHTGSVNQSPVEDAKLAIQTAVKVAEGQSVPPVQRIPTPTVDAQNVTTFTRPTW